LFRLSVDLFDDVVATAKVVNVATMRIESTILITEFVRLLDKTVMVYLVCMLN